MTMGGESVYRVLICMLGEIDMAEFTKSGKLIAWPTLRRIRERTGVCPDTIVKARTRLRKLGLIVCLNPERAGPDQPSVYEIIDRPIQRVGGALSPTLPERVGHARDERLAIRMSKRSKRPAAALLVVTSWPDGEPLPPGIIRRAD